ncbi:MAG TPA: hypothetical protein VJO34_07585 [Methylomirabilota bacterium]|nr:hypothetical protein [Methylomirabilota bacterium]
MINRLSPSHVWQALSFALSLLLVAPESSAQELKRVPALVHVHSTLSTGVHSLEHLVSLAKDQGIEAILLTENFLLRIDYDLFPVRVKVTEYPSVLRMGVDAYLKEVARVQSRHPDVLLLPGVEVIPYTYWTGSLLTGDLTHHDLQKNLLVFGITNPDDLKRLPTLGNPWTGHYEWRSLLLLTPALLVLAGLWLFLKPARRANRMGRFVVVQVRRHWVSGGALTALGLLGLISNYPYAIDPLASYGANATLVPHQALIDYVRARGGVTIWSLPEAADRSSHSLFGLTVRAQTDPYPDDLIKTDRYTAFGAVYDQATRLPVPGERWDYLLEKFLGRQREVPGWAIGEAAYHSASAGKRLGGIQTVFWVEEKSPAGVLESLRRGRFYALRKASAPLVLEEWSVVQSNRAAISGDRLRATGTGPIEVRMAVAAADGSQLPVRLTLIRGSELAGVWSGKTPFRMNFKDPVAPARGYYRLEVRGPSPNRILTNPIFVEREN